MSIRDIEPTMSLKEMRRKYQGVHERALQEYSQYGVDAVDKPDESEAPRLPRNLPTLLQEELLHLMVRYRRWSEYIGEQRLWVKLSVESLKARKRGAEGVILRSLGDVAGTQKEREKMVFAMEPYINLDEKLLAKQHVYRMLDQEYKRLYADTQVLEGLILPERLANEVSDDYEEDIEE